MPATVSLLSRTRRRLRSPAEVALLLRVGATMLCLPLLARVDVPTMVRWLGYVGRMLRPGRSHRVEDIVRMTRSYGGLHWWAFQDNCVAQSLTLFALLDTAAAPLDLVFGVEVLGTADGAPQLGRRHVWLERAGTAVYEREPLDLRRYVVQTRHRRASTGSVDGRSLSLLRVLGASSLSTGLTSVATVVRTKIVAVVLGPAGVAISGQLSQALSALSWLATFGTGAGTTRFLSEAIARRDEEAAGQVVRTSALVLAAAGALLMVAGVAFAPALSSSLFGVPTASAWVWWLVATVPPAAVLSLSTALLRGAGQAERLAMAQGAGAVLAVAASLTIVTGATVDALAPLAMVVMTAQAATTTLAAWPLLRRWQVPSRGAVSLSLASEMAGYGLANVVMGLATAAATLTVGRTYLAAGLTTEAGRIAALAWLAEPLAGALVSGLHASSFPAYCAAARAEAPQVLSRAVRALVVLTAPVLLIASVGAGALLRLMFSVSFAGLAPLLTWQLVATYLRCINVLLGLPLLARGRIVPLTALHLGWAAMAAIGATWTLAGSQGYVSALLGASVVQTVGLLAVLRVAGLSPRSHDLAWIAGGATLLVVAALV